MNLPPTPALMGLSRNTQVAYFTDLIVLGNDSVTKMLHCAAGGRADDGKRKKQSSFLRGNGGGGGGGGAKEGGRHSSRHCSAALLTFSRSLPAISCPLASFLSVCSGNPWEISSSATFALIYASSCRNAFGRWAVCARPASLTLRRRACTRVRARHKVPHCLMMTSSYKTSFTIEPPIPPPSVGRHPIITEN